MRVLLPSLMALGQPLAHAAEPPQGVGVVLGGGGARGFAHLGVLKELERLRIPIACIAGTSAGALIGGIYANGLPLDEMEREFDQADWEQMLSGKPNRAEVPYDRKRDDYKNYLDVTFGVKDGAMRVPRGAINSQAIDLYIHRLTRDRVIDDFDKLPIPFRAVAADLLTGEPVVFKQGALSRALRASMAVPGVFDLVEEDGKLLVDGAIARNVPVQDVKGRCAKHVIVIDVGSPLLKSTEIQTLFDVVAQSSNLAVSRNVRGQMRLLDEKDIVIRPDLNGYTAASFGDHQAIAARGAAAARALQDKLAAYSVSKEAYAAWQKRLVKPRYPVLDEIQVEGGEVSKIRQAGLAKSLAVAGAAESVSHAQGKLNEAFASGGYDKIGYRVEEISGRNVMTVMPVERSIGTNYLHFGLTLSSDTPGDSHFNFLASHEWTDINSAGASWRNAVSTGHDRLFKTEFYQPLGAGNPMFVAASLGYREQLYPFYAEDHIVLGQLQNNILSTQLNAGWALGKYGEFRLGVYHDDNRIQPSIGSSDPDLNQRYLDIGVQTSLVVDQFDNPRWPRNGYYFSGKLSSGMPSWGSDVNQKAYDLTAETASTYGDLTARLTFKARGIAADSRNGDFVPQTLGGFLNLTGYQTGELLGDQVALARLMMYWRAASLPSVLGSGLYAGVSLEAGRVWGHDWFNPSQRWIPAGSVFLGADTILGPFFIGMGTARGGQLTGYIYLGVNY